MDHKDFQAYYTIPTKLIKNALKILELLFCQPSCLPHCSNSCTQHYLPRTLLPQYIIRNPHILPSQRLSTPHPPPHPLYPLPPQFILNNLIHFPIHSILDHKEHKIFDKYKIIKKYTSYLCQWILPNQCIYTKWIPQHKLLPWTIQTTPNHNIPPLIHYYKTKQHQYYSTLLLKHFHPTQPKDTRYITPELFLPLVHLSIQECNHDKDIITNTPTIAIQHEQAHIYDNIGLHLTTIPTLRLNWLWFQYHTTLHNPSNFTPPIQSFETELVWLYHRYKPRLSKNDPLNSAQYILPTAILNHIFDSFQITHSYFSSPVTCPTSIYKFYSPFPRDKIFGSLGPSFQYQWQGLGYAHPHNAQDAQQVLYWARSAASNDLDNITIIALPNKNWYKNITPLKGPFPDTHVIAYFPPDTLTYEESITPAPLITEPRIETAALHIYCVHYKNYPIYTHLHNHTFQQLLQQLNIQHTQLLYVPPTPHLIQVNNCKIWNSLTYPPIITCPHLIPPLPHYQYHPLPKFPPCYNYYTDSSFKPPKQRINGTWKPETTGSGIYNPINHINISTRLPGLQNILRAELLAIHHTLQILLAQFPHEPAYIFTDSLNSIYLLLLQIKHPTRHTSHPDKKFTPNNGSYA
jgi:hypothetical protein